nr:DUF4277 domain-containing protein [Anabaena sp. UHCC 0253]
MELVEEVNKIVGIKIKETLTPGQVIKAMSFKWIRRFLSAPLYLFGEVFRRKINRTFNRRRSISITFK